MGDAAAEMLAKEMQAIVAADRWKGRDLSAAPPEKWSHLRPETQQFWIDTAARILAALPAASGEDNATLRDRLARMEGAMIWCSAASDFAEGGVAREGWLKLCAPLIAPDAADAELPQSIVADQTSALTDGGSNG